MLIGLSLFLACAAAQCANGWTTSTVTDLSNAPVFSIDRASGTTTIKKLDNALLAALVARLDALEAEVALLKSAAKSTFVAWGSQTCPAPSTRVFSGLAMGSGKSQSGGGADLLCMPFENGGNIRKTATASVGTRGYIYHAEFNTTTAGSTQQPVLRNQDNFESRCALCEVSGPTHMLAGRQTCLAGWTALYKGVLMASPSVDAGRLVHICMLEPPRETFGQGVLDGGPQLSVVEFRRVGAATATSAYAEFTENADLADVVCVVCVKS